MRFNFIMESISDSITWRDIFPQVWNLALLYFGWDIIKWCDIKFDKIFKRFKSKERGF